MIIWGHLQFYTVLFSIDEQGASWMDMPVNTVNTVNSKYPLISLTNRSCGDNLVIFSRDYMHLCYNTYEPRIYFQSVSIRPVVLQLSTQSMKSILCALRKNPGCGHHPRDILISWLPFIVTDHYFGRLETQYRLFIQMCLHVCLHQINSKSMQIAKKSAHTFCLDAYRKKERLFSSIII